MDDNYENSYNVINFCFDSFMYFARTKQSSKNIDENVGWLHGNCLAIKTPNISINSEFTLVHLDDEKTTEIASIKQKANSGEDCIFRIRKVSSKLRPYHNAI